MRELYVFIAIKGDLYSVVITENDTVLTHKTQYKKSKDKNISIRAMKSALSSLGRYVNNDDCLVNFVMPNSYIEKWIKDG